MFVSGEDAAKQQGLVGSKGITHIINCAGPQCPNYLEYVRVLGSTLEPPLAAIDESSESCRAMSLALSDLSFESPHADVNVGGVHR